MRSLRIQRRHFYDILGITNSAPLCIKHRAAFSGGLLDSKLWPQFSDAMEMHKWKLPFWLSASQIKKRRVSLPLDVKPAVVQRESTTVNVLPLCHLDEHEVDAFCSCHPPPLEGIAVMREGKWRRVSTEHTALLNAYATNGCLRSSRLWIDATEMRDMLHVSLPMDEVSLRTDLTVDWYNISQLPPIEGIMPTELPD